MSESSKIYSNPTNVREIKYIIDTIEDCWKFREIKHLRVLRDLFSSDSKKRGVATHILKKNWSRPEIEDILKETFEIADCASDAFTELNIYSSGITDYSFFNYENLYKIFTGKSDCTFKKSAIEQLSILINDRSDSLGVSGRKLFREKKTGVDVFSISIQEVIKLHQQTAHRGIDSLHPNESNYLQELLRFLVLSFLFYFDEPVVSELLKPYHAPEDTEEFEKTLLWTLLDILREWLSSKQIVVRKHALRCLQVILVNDHVKICIDMNSGMPYFFVPTYMTNTYEFLFPTVSYFCLNNRKCTNMQLSVK